MLLRHLAGDDLDALMPALVELLAANVADGASVGFHAPLADAEAEGYWRGVQAGLRRGDRVLVAAFHEGGALMGAAQLALESRPNGRHRAEVQKVLVAPAARRQGVGRALMHALDEAGRAAGRSLLFLDTREGDAAERMYRALGWEQAGRLPGYVREADGTAHATLFFYRELDAPRDAPDD